MLIFDDIISHDDDTHIIRCEVYEYMLMGNEVLGSNFVVATYDDEWVGRRYKFRRRNAILECKDIESKHRHANTASIDDIISINENDKATILRDFLLIDW